MRRLEHPGRSGFTLVEILITVAIIGVLSTISVVAVNQARAKARETRALADLSQIRTAIGLLEQATGKWPNGCPAWEVKNPEVDLSTAAAAIALEPTVSDQGDGCEWIAEDIARWEGPYMTQTTDPWGAAYVFDPDYVPYQNCGTETTGDEGAFVVSFGPNGAGLNIYDCDDLFLKLR